MFEENLPRMLDLVSRGLAENFGKVFKDFRHTDCDIFGGDVSTGPRVIPSKILWWIILVLFKLCFSPPKAF